jgi:hypothetical protein
MDSRRERFADCIRSMSCSKRLVHTQAAGQSTIPLDPRRQPHHGCRQCDGERRDPLRRAEYYRRYRVRCPRSSVAAPDPAGAAVPRWPTADSSVRRLGIVACNWAPHSGSDQVRPQICWASGAALLSRHLDSHLRSLVQVRFVRYVTVDALPVTASARPLSIKTGSLWSACLVAHGLTSQVLTGPRQRLREVLAAQLAANRTE